MQPLGGEVVTRGERIVAGTVGIFLLGVALFLLWCLVYAMLANVFGFSAGIAAPVAIGVVVAVGTGCGCTIAYAFGPKKEE